MDNNLCMKCGAGRLFADGDVDAFGGFSILYIHTFDTSGRNIRKAAVITFAVDIYLNSIHGIACYGYGCHTFFGCFRGLIGIVGKGA